MSGGLANASDTDIRLCGWPGITKTGTQGDAKVKATTFPDSPELRYHGRFSVSKVKVGRKLRFCIARQVLPSTFCGNLQVS